jgi:predicted transcriptional regulator
VIHSGHAPGRCGRDFKGVHTDVGMLVDAGVVDGEKKVVFPYDKIHVGFEISAAT